MFRSALLLLCTVVAATLLPPVGRATGGRYAFAGGTPRQQAEVVRARDASSFDWDVVPVRVTIHIERGVLSRATPGQIWLDADLLEAGTFAWGVVQHEFAHQVDFFVLTTRRDQLGCERFASMLAWSYWPSPDNCMRAAADGSLNARRFRALLSASIPLGSER
jgi:hypothetical protein